MDCRISGIDARAAAHQAHLDRQGDLANAEDQFLTDAHAAMAACWTDADDTDGFPVLDYGSKGPGRAIRRGTAADLYENGCGYEECDAALLALLTAKPGEEAAKLAAYRAAAVARYQRMTDDEYLIDLGREWGVL